MPFQVDGHVKVAGVYIERHYPPERWAEQLERISDPEEQEQAREYLRGIYRRLQTMNKLKQGPGVSRGTFGAAAKAALFGLLALAVLAGCQTTGEIDPTYRVMVEQHERSQTQRLQFAAEMATGCETDLCRYMVTERATQGAGHVPEYRAPRSGLAEFGDFMLSAVQVAAPWLGSIGIAQEHRKTVTGVAELMGAMAPTDNSIRVSGNYGDTDQSVNAGGNVGDTRGDETVIGGDQIGGDRIANRGRIGSDGDNIGGDLIRDRGRRDSPGDNRDQSPGPNEGGGDPEPEPEPDPDP